MLNVFLRLTLAIAAVLVIFAILNFVLHTIVFAAVVAALVLGVLFLINFFRRAGTGIRVR